MEEKYCACYHLMLLSWWPQHRSPCFCSLRAPILYLDFSWCITSPSIDAWLLIGSYTASPGKLSASCDERLWLPVPLPPAPSRPPRLPLLSSLQTRESSCCLACFVNSAATLLALITHHWGVNPAPYLGSSGVKLSSLMARIWLYFSHQIQGTGPHIVGSRGYGSKTYMEGIGTSACISWNKQTRKGFWYVESRVLCVLPGGKQILHLQSLAQKQPYSPFPSDAARL